MARRRRAPNKGKCCKRWKRVRMKGGKMVRRCASFGAKASGGYRKRRGTRKSQRRRTARRAYSKRRRPAGMAKRGSRCVRFKRVRVRGGGMQRRCAKYAR